MISAIFSIFNELFSFLLNLLPDSFISSALEEASEEITVVINVIGYINYWLPLDKVYLIFNIWATAMTALWVYYTIKNRI